MSSNATAIPFPDGPDVDIGASLLAVEWTLAGLAGIVLGLRLFTVSWILRRVQVADYLMLAAFVCAVVQGALLSVAYRWGLGRHLYYLTEEERVQSLRYIFLLEGWGIASPMFGRISFCFFMLGLVPYRSLRVILWSSIVFQVLVNGATIVVVYSQCGSHPAAFYDPSVHGDCLNPSIQTNVSYFQSAWNSFTDLYLTIIPAVLLWNVKIELLKKLTVVVLLSLSIFAFVTSVVKAVEIEHLNDRGDLTWGLTKMHYWAVSENYVVIITASVPLLNALVKRGRQMTSGTGSYGLSASRTNCTHAQSVYTVGKDATHTWRTSDVAVDESREHILLTERALDAGMEQDERHSDVTLTAYQTKAKF